MGFSVAFTFGTGEAVKITQNGVVGAVEGLWIDRNGTRQVRVRYRTATNAIAEQWFYESDLEPVGSEHEHEQVSHTG